MISKGQPAWSEQPLYMLQAYDNRPSCRCCSYCSKFLGSNVDMVRCLDTRRPRVVSAKISGCIPCNMEADTSSGSNKCTHLYCSSECRDDAIKKHGHAFICTCSGDQSLMGQFFKFAETQQQVIGDERRAQLDHNYIYAAEITARLICSARTACLQVNAGARDLSVHLEAAVREYFDHFYGQTQTAGVELVGRAGLPAEVPVYYRTASYFPDAVVDGTAKGSTRIQGELEEQCCESWYLFSAALAMEKRCFHIDGVSTDVSDTLNAEFWAKLLSTIDLYFSPVAVESPLVAAAKSLRQLKGEAKLRLYHELTANRTVDGVVVDIANRPECIFEPATFPEPVGGGCAAGCNIVLPGARGAVAADRGDPKDSASAIELDRAVELLIQQALYTTTVAGATEAPKDIFSANPFSNPYITANYVGIALVPSACGRPVEAGTTVRSRRIIGHSCVPNLVMEAVVQQQPYLVSCQFSALRDLSIDEPATPLSMCFIARNEEDLEGRNSQLRRKVHLHGQFGVGAEGAGTIACACERCVYEFNNGGGEAAKAQVVPDTGSQLAVRGQQGSAELPYRTLLAIAYQAMQEARYEDAAELLVMMTYRLLSVLTDASCERGASTRWELLRVMREGVHALGACCLEAGFWEQGHVVWALGQSWFTWTRDRCIENARSSGVPVAEMERHLLDAQCEKDVIYRNVLLEEGSMPRGANADILSLDYHHCVRLVPPRAPASGAAGETASLWGKKSAQTAPSPAAAPGIYISSIPILSPQQCDKIIESAEDHIASANGGKWLTSRHYSVPTTDIAAHAVPALQDWFCKDIVVGVVKPLFLKQYRQSAGGASAGEGIHADDVLIHDVFVVKYEASVHDQDTQKSLPLHYDQSSHSFVIVLSDNCFADKINQSAGGACYSGGGTFFPALSGSDIGVVPNSPEGVADIASGAGHFGANGVCAHKGHICTFVGGDVLHAGETVLSGIRYIVAGFVYLRTGAGAPRLTPVKECISALAPGPPLDASTRFKAPTGARIAVLSSSFQYRDEKDVHTTADAVGCSAAKKRRAGDSEEADARSGPPPAKEFKFSFDNLFTE